MIARTLRDVFNTANPAPLASDDPRYVDCTSVRGNEDVVEQLFRRVTWSDQSHTAQLFTGHRGCGKSTELLRLKQRLEAANYAVIYFEADEVIDVEDVVYSDILVAIARQVYEGFEQLKVPLDQQLLDDIFAWFAEKVLHYESAKAAEAELAGEFEIGSPPFFSALAKILARVTGRLRTSVESKVEIRRQLDPQITQLIDQINLLLQTGIAQLRKRGKQGLVIIVDNLDRIPFRLVEDTRRTLHDALYIDHGEQLRACRCHIIYTVPIAMFYSPQAAILSGIFPDNLILPMIKTSERNGDPCQAGRQTLRQILGSRIDLEGIFEEAALDLLCNTSGGHPRLLMTLVRNACGYAVNRMPRPIDLNAVERAVNRLVSEYSRAIPEEHFALLAQVHHNKQVENDDPHRLMLHNLSVLEYVNGGEPWHDVHPAVQRLEKFQRAYNQAYGKQSARRRGKR
jgi:GTPase SAR1 family protein